MASKVVSEKNIFDLDGFKPVEKTPLQSLRAKRDFSSLTLDSSEVNSSLARAALKSSRNVLANLTLEGSWPDEDLKTFTPYMENVSSLHLVNISFTNEAFDEAFISDSCHENPFADDLDTYQEPSEMDEWDSAPVTLPKRPAPYTDELLDFSQSNTSLSEGNDELDAWGHSFKTSGSTGSLWPLSDEVKDGSRHRTLEGSKSSHKPVVNCPKLISLTIENPKGLTKGFISKLLPLKEQLTSLTLINCPEAPSIKELQRLFPNLQTIVIK